VVPMKGSYVAWAVLLGVVSTGLIVFGLGQPKLELDDPKLIREGHHFVTAGAIVAVPRTIPLAARANVPFCALGAVVLDARAGLSRRH
jgi:hypothetical protein